MRTTGRLILGIAGFVAAAGVVSAQQPHREPTLPPIPKARLTPTPLPEGMVKMPVLQLVPIQEATRKPAPATANKKPEAAAEAAASVTVNADSPSPTPAGAAPAGGSAGTTSPAPSPKSPPAIADTAQRKNTSVGSWILLGVGGLALIGLAVFFVRSRRGADTMPPLFEHGVPPSTPARSKPDRP